MPAGVPPTVIHPWTLPRPKAGPASSSYLFSIHTGRDSFAFLPLRGTGKNYGSNQFLNWLQQYATGILLFLIIRVPSRAEHEIKEEIPNYHLQHMRFIFHLHPYRMHLEYEGLSHGLKTVHRTVFFTPFRVPSS